MRIFLGSWRVPTVASVSIEGSDVWKPSQLRLTLSLGVPFLSGGAAHIVDFMPPRRDSAVGCSAKPAATGWAPTTAPPEPPEEEVLGRPVLKDFVDEVTKKIRAFKGYVRRRYKSDGRCVVHPLQGCNQFWQLKCNSMGNPVGITHVQAWPASPLLLSMHSPFSDMLIQPSNQHLLRPPFACHATTIDAPVVLPFSAPVRTCSSSHTAAGLSCMRMVIGRIWNGRRCGL